MDRSVLARRSNEVLSISVTTSLSEFTRIEPSYEHSDATRDTPEHSPSGTPSLVMAWCITWLVAYVKREGGQGEREWKTPHFAGSANMKNDCFIL